MKYSELLSDARNNLSKEQILASEAVRIRVNRTKQLIIEPGRIPMSKIRLMRKFMFMFFESHISKPIKQYNVFSNIHDYPCHGKPNRLLTEHKQES